MDDRTRRVLRCPVCDVDLARADRQGVEVDYCPSCRGVWMDRGELDKIIDRSDVYERPARISDEPRPDWSATHRFGERGEERGRLHKRKTFLREFFDPG